MKFTAALASIAGLAMAGSHHVPFTHLELAQMGRVDATAASKKMQFAQVAGPTTEGDVGHPDDRETESPILDRHASDKMNGLVSWQRFLDHHVSGMMTTYAEGEGDRTTYPENGLYNKETHVCAYRFRWEQPFAGYTDRWMIAATHDCPDNLTPPIGGFRFVITLGGYDIIGQGALVGDNFRDRFNPHPATPVNLDMLAYDGSDSTITFELNNDTAASHSRFAILLPISYNAMETDTEDEDGKWTYTYEILAQAAYSASD